MRISGSAASAWRSRSNIRSRHSEFDSPGRIAESGTFSYDGLRFSAISSYSHIRILFMDPPLTTSRPHFSTSLAPILRLKLRSSLKYLYPTAWILRVPRPHLCYSSRTTTDLPIFTVVPSLRVIHD